MKRTLLLLAIALSAVVAAQPSDRERSEAQAARTTQRLQELHQEAERLAAEARTLLGDLRKLEIERQIRSEEFRKADAEAAAASAEVTDLTRQIADLEGRTRREQPELRARMVELYKLGQGRYVRLLLATSDVRRLGEASRMVAALARRDRDRIEAHQRRIADLADRRQAADVRRRELAALRTEAERAHAAVERAVAERNALMREIDRRRDLNAQLAGELQLAQDRLQQTLQDASGGDRSTAVDNASIPLRPFRGALDWPVSGAGVSVRRRFGSRASGATGNGMEIAAPEGITVTAIHDGTVAFADTFAGYGRLVIVDHGAQNFSLYGHLLAVDVQTGARVAAGQPIGKVGRTMTGEAGLYFELRVDARPVDPLQWLTGSAPRAARSGF